MGIVSKVRGSVEYTINNEKMLLKKGMEVDTSGLITFSSKGDYLVVDYFDEKKHTLTDKKRSYPYHGKILRGSIAMEKSFEGNEDSLSNARSHAVDYEGFSCEYMSKITFDNTIGDFKFLPIRCNAEQPMHSSQIDVKLMDGDTELLSSPIKKITNFGNIAPGTYKLLFTYQGVPVKKITVDISDNVIERVSKLINKNLPVKEKIRLAVALNKQGYIYLSEMARKGRLSAVKAQGKPSESIINSRYNNYLQQSYENTVK